MCNNFKRISNSIKTVDNDIELKFGKLFFLTYGSIDESISNIR